LYTGLQDTIAKDAAASKKKIQMRFIVVILQIIQSTKLREKHCAQGKHKKEYEHHSVSNAPIRKESNLRK